MTRTPTSFRLSEEARRLLGELADTLDLERTAIIERALSELSERESTGDTWVGTGIWRGWRITSAHAASSYGQPVLVMPDGTPLGPGDITSSLERLYKQRQMRRG